MKQTFVILFFIQLIAMNTLSQTTPIAGTYALTGMHEMAGAFEFTRDNHFRFFYSYGAADRMAEGTYTVENNKVILKSNKEAGKDFTVIKEDASSSTFTVKVIEQNQYLAEMVKCVVLNGNKQDEFFADRNGLIQIDLPKAEKIYLQHQLFPDILSLIKDENNHNTYFEVTLNPTLQNVSFKGIDLTIDADTLHMPINYFMPFKNIRFVKQ